MEMNLRILSGQRKGQTLLLPLTSEGGNMPSHWLLETEAIEIRLTVSKQYRSADLALYDHVLPVTWVESTSDEMITLIWTPRKSAWGFESLFFNYFGTAELAVTLNDDRGQPAEMLRFQPVEVLASKSTADKIEDMFGYLAELSPEALYSVFSATRQSAGYGEGTITPVMTQERLAHALARLHELLPYLAHKPITRLVPEYQLVGTLGDEPMDESSAAWLTENLSVLTPCDSPLSSHLVYEGQYYRANSLQMPLLQENTDLYENQVIHGFVRLLLAEAQLLAQRFGDPFSSPARYATPPPEGYVSFFTKMDRFRKEIMGQHIERCHTLVEQLKQVKFQLERHLPVRQTVRERPIFTQKVRSHTAYRELFFDIVRWHERGRLDWSAYDNLFAIESLSTLFETYCYFRTQQAVASYFFAHAAKPHETGTFVTKFLDGKGTEVRVLREPDYWTVGHPNALPNTPVNSEGYTVFGRERGGSRSNSKVIRTRGKRGDLSRRIPDIVIEICIPDHNPQLLVLDAKYTNPWKAFAEYMPELTLKYVHGINLPGDSKPPVVSLSVLHPEQDSSGFRSFHEASFNLFSDTAVTPNLQCIGVELAPSRVNECWLDKVLHRLLQSHGVVRHQLLQSVESAA